MLDATVCIWQGSLRKKMKENGVQKFRALEKKTQNISIPQKQKIRLKKVFEGEMPGKTCQSNKLPTGKNLNEASNKFF